MPDRSKYELRRHYFSHTIVSVWNSLPDSVVSAEAVNSFKSRLDKFWSLHDFLYDYRASPLVAEVKCQCKACFHYGCALRCVASDSQR